MCSFRVQYFWGPGHFVNIHDITVESAGVAVDTEKAALVEHCTCPEGYTGLSCEVCEINLKFKRTKKRKVKLPSNTILFNYFYLNNLTTTST